MLRVIGHFSDSKVAFWKSVHIRMNKATYERWKRLQGARGTTEFGLAVLDAYEKSLKRKSSANDPWSYAPCGCRWLDCKCYKTTCQHIDHTKACLKRKKAGPRGPADVEK